MIFVTVGTHYLGFDRLVKKMDEIATETDEDIIMQIGHTLYEPRNTKWFRFVEMDEIVKFYHDANIIVTHAGAGSILDSLKYGKSIVLVPRRKKYGEHIDDQQLELSRALENSGKCLVVYDINNMSVMIRRADKNEIKPLKTDKNLLKYIKTILSD